MAKPPRKPLTARREKFAQEYAKCLVANEAARRAGYRDNPNTIGKTCGILMSDPGIRARLAELQSGAAEKAEIDAAWVMRKCREQIEWGMSRDTAPARAIANDALKFLGKHFGLATERLEVSGPNGSPLQITRIERIIVDPKDPDSSEVSTTSPSE